MSQEHNSTPTKLALERITPESFAGISKDMELVVIFPGDKNITILEGDQGTCKSSMLDALKFIFTGESADNAINSKDNSKKVEAVINDSEENVKYVIKATKTGFNVSMVQQKEDGPALESTVKEPKTFLRKKIGPVGVDPTFLKKMDGADQVKWIRSLFTLSKEELEQEARITKGIADAIKNRRAANKSLRSLRVKLTDSPYYTYSKSNKELSKTQKFTEADSMFSKPVDERQKQVNDRFDAAQAKAKDRDLHSHSHNNLLGTQREINSQIDILEKRLVALREQKIDLDNRVLDSEQTKASFINVDNELTEARKEMDGMNQYFVGKTVFDQLKQAAIEYAAAEESWKAAVGELTTYQQKQLEAIQAFTPDIESLEVCVPRDIDVAEEREIFLEINPEATEAQIHAHIMALENDKREGLFYKGQSMLNLCESEAWELCLKIWDFLKVRVVFIENISSLGSNAIDSINQFAEHGGLVYATCMRRGVNKMEYNFFDAISDAKL